MNSKTLVRLERVMDAARSAAMARHAAIMRKIQAKRAKARAYRQQSASAGPARDATEMLQIAAWQRTLERRARHAEQEARELEQQAIPLRQALARALGRENAVGMLLDRAQKQELQKAEARIEEIAEVARLCPPSHMG